MPRATHFLPSLARIAVLLALSQLLLPHLVAQSGTAPAVGPPLTSVSTPTPSPVAIKGPVTVQGSVILIDDEDQAARDEKLDREKKSLAASESSARASEDSARISKGALWVSVVACVISIVQLFVIIVQFLPTLRALQKQSTIDSLNQVKQRLDSLTGGQFNLSENSLYTPIAETTSDRNTRIENITDQLCDREDELRRSAVKRLIQQWIELEEEFDKQIKLKK